MAILKSLVIRGASQRLGGMVLYTRSGETIARELAPAVSNPRTRIQMEQRIKLGNVVAMYRANRSWMAGAFEDKKEKESDYNAFVRMNLTTSRVALTKGHIAAGAGVVAPYQVSSGSIPSIECTGTMTGVYTNLFMGNLILTSATTVGQFSEALLQNNNIITEGMQLSLIINIQSRNEAFAMPYITLRAYEVIIKANDAALLSEYIPLELLSIRESEGHPLNFVGESLGDGAACFVLSQTISGRTKVSSQTMVFYGHQSVYSIYTSAIAVNAAIESYGTNADRFLDSNEAKDASAVVITNYIQAMSYNSQYYVAGSTINMSFSTSKRLSLYFSQPVNEAVTVKFVLAADGTRRDVSNIAWNTEKTILSFDTPTLQGTDYPADVSILVESLAESFDFYFTAEVGNNTMNTADPDSRDVGESTEEAQGEKKKK